MACRGALRGGQRDAGLLPGKQVLLAQVVRLLSQRWVRYRHGPLSVTGTPSGNGPRPGDRLPDQTVTTYDGHSVRLHELTAPPGVHVLLQRDARALHGAGLGAHTTVHRIGSWPGRGLLAVRPDGHVGFRCGESDRGQLESWLGLVGAR